MNRIVKQHFRVAGFDDLAGFYCDLLGMDEISSSAETCTFGYDQNQCCIEFKKKPVSPYTSEPNDFYWKIGITLHNLDVAVEYLRACGYAVNTPQQFRDIGYLTSITDPNGFKIELLQQGFEGNVAPVPDGHPIGAQATLAHITLRVTNLDAATLYFEKQLQMRLMSIQPVSEYGFCLYFYTWSEEELPTPDLRAIENREWLWQRPYVFIELQHLETPNTSVLKTPKGMAGFNGFTYSDNEDATLISTDDLTCLR